MAEPVCPMNISLESIRVLSEPMQKELVAMARRMKFELGSESEPGSWRCELGGYFWWAKAEERAA